MSLQFYTNYCNYFQDEEKIIKLSLDKCKQSLDCRLQIVLDKKNRNLMTFCVIVSEEEICFVSTCTCPTKRTRRDIPSHLVTENPISGPNIKKSTCSFKINSKKTISDKKRRNCTNQKDDMSVNLKENASFKSGKRCYNSKNYDEKNKYV